MANATVMLIMLSIQARSPDVIDVARQYKWSTIAYIASIVAVAIATVLFTWMSNRLQEAVKAEAEAKTAAANAIAETAKRDAAVADAKAANALRDASVANKSAGEANDSAAKANERAQKLERDNIQLSTDLENATAEARARQAELAKEQAKLSAEQRRTAEAQRETAVAQLALKKHLEEVAERQKWRQLSDDQRRKLQELLKSQPKGSVIVVSSVADEEARNFANQLRPVLTEAGWNVTDGGFVSFGKTPNGLRLVFGREGSPGGPEAQVLFDALNSVFGADSRFDNALPETQIRLIVGTKP